MTNQEFDKLRGLVKEFPDSAGVYVFRNVKMDILYVGKATSLKKRVSSYFPNSKKNFKIHSLLSEAEQIEFVVTSSPYEALLLECNFIKKYSPKFNVRLKDSKNYQYIKLTHDDYPALLKVRKVLPDQAQYFGPYTSGKAVVYMVKLLAKTFKLRTCHLKLKEKVVARPCLLHFIHQCSGPCAGLISKEMYHNYVKDAILFLKNDYKPLKNKLIAEMKEEAKKENFEYAAIIRDQMQSIDEIIQHQRVIYAKSFDQDVVSLYTYELLSCVELLKIREGKIIFEDSFFMESVLEESPAEILEQFLLTYYLEMTTSSPPNEILLSDAISDAESVERSIAERFHMKSIHIIRPLKGDRKKVVDIGKENAKKHFEIKYKDQFSVPMADIKPILFSLQKTLHLPSIPLRIEGYDISNISGQQSYGSMVVFINGKPSPQHYRIFKIKNTVGPNDVGMIKEVLTRRITHTDEKFGSLPDLFLIDGGLPQLNSAISVIHGEGNLAIPVFSLAKREELIYISSDLDPIRLEKSSEILRLFQYIRDESHRFAKKHFTKLHRKEALSGKNRVK
jgi:excinuclease ABC subunit C